MLPDTYRKVHASCKVATLTSRVFCNGERDGGSLPQPAKICSSLNLEKSPLSRLPHPTKIFIPPFPTTKGSSPPLNNNFYVATN